MIRRITQIYEFEEQDDFESLNRSTMDIAKLLIDNLDAKYTNLIEIGSIPCGGTEVIVNNLFYITIMEEDIHMYIHQSGKSLTITYQDCVNETMHSILKWIM